MTSSVSESLTAKRPAKVVENREYAGMIRRVLRAFGRRVGDGDVEALAYLLAVSKDVDQAIISAVEGLREFGYSWSEIARCAGVTKQTAHERWSSKIGDAA